MRVLLPARVTACLTTLLSLLSAAASTTEQHIFKCAQNREAHQKN